MGTTPLVPLPSCQSHCPFGFKSVQVVKEDDFKNRITCLKKTGLLYETIGTCLISAVFEFFHISVCFVFSTARLDRFDSSDRQASPKQVCNHTIQNTAYI